MKKLLLLLLLFPSLALAQRNNSNPLGANLSVQDAGTCSTTGSFAWQILPNNAATTTVNLAGTFTATVTFRLSNNGGGTWITSSTSTTAGTTSIATNGFTDICADVTAFTSGTVNVTISTGLNTGPVGPAGPAGGANVSASAVPGSPGINAVPITSGLMAEYRILPSETPASLVDYSGNGNNATGTTGTAPTIITISGGLQCNQNGSVAVPAALNSALSIIALAGFQNSASSQISNAIWQGSTSPENALQVTTNSPAVNTLLGGSRLATRSNNAIKTQTNIPFNGVAVIAETMAATDHVYINGQETSFYTSTGTSAGIQTTGAYGICGAAGNYWQGQVYYIAFYNRVLTQTEVFSISQYMIQNLITRGLPSGFSGGSGAINGIGLYATDVHDSVLSTGDSIPGGTGLTTRWQSQIVSTTGLSTITDPMANNGLPGKLLGNMVNDANIEEAPMIRINGRNYMDLWAGTNDCAAANSASQIMQKQAAFSKIVRAQGWKLAVTTMPSRGGGLDTCKNNWNTLLRQTWQNIADVLIDEAAQPLLGADGANVNATWFQGDTIHPTQGSASNFHTAFHQHAYNAFYGNQSFSTGNTYTATSTAATTITAATESTNTVTLTMGSNPWVAGQMCTVTGVTPAGYNSPVGAWWFILTANATTVTFFNPTSGLGAGSIFGTIQCPQEVDADVYATLGGSAAGPIHLLQSCQVHLGQPIFRRITNTNATPWVITPIAAAETINGGATFTTPVASATNNPVIRLDAILTSASAGGCTWKASIQ